MIEKGYIEEVLDKYTYKVRIPRYDKAAFNANAVALDQLATAEVCALPGCQPYYYTGETVWVEFYNDQYTSPIIIGRLFSNSNQTASKIYLDKNSNIDMSNSEYATRITALEKKLSQNQVAVFG